MAGKSDCDSIENTALSFFPQALVGFDDEESKGIFRFPAAFWSRLFASTNEWLLKQTFS
jgi:hypothetical protein